MSSYRTRDSDVATSTSDGSYSPSMETRSSNALRSTSVHASASASASVERRYRQASTNQTASVTARSYPAATTGYYTTRTTLSSVLTSSNTVDLGVPIMSSSMSRTNLAASALSDRTVASVSSISSPSASYTAVLNQSTGLSTSSGLSTTSKAVLGGVLGGLGGIGLICAFVVLVFTKGHKRKRPESSRTLATPQRMDDRNMPMRSSGQCETPSRFKTGLALISARRRPKSLNRPRKNSEPSTPTAATGSFQVISGRRLSSPPRLHPATGDASRIAAGSVNSSPRSALTTPSRRSRLGGTPTIFRDAIGRSQELGSTASHMSRFVEAIDGDAPNAISQ